MTTIVVVASVDEAQRFATSARWMPSWCVRDGVADDATLIRKVLEAWSALPGEGFVWIAAEAGVARALRPYMIDDRLHPRQWIKAAGIGSAAKPTRMSASRTEGGSFEELSGKNRHLRRLFGHSVTSSLDGPVNR